jgi:hypothetical protein
LVGIELALLEVVAVVTGEIAERADRLGHHIEGSGEGREQGGGVETLKG